jgi:hypothetical protein
VLVGTSARLRVVVSHTYRARDQVIRLISARRANRAEREDYERRWEAMKKHYDFSKGKKNPYARRLKKQITIRLDEEIGADFALKRTDLSARRFARASNKASSNAPIITIAARGAAESLHICASRQRRRRIAIMAASAMSFGNSGG